jgi:hypothetical protein
MKVRVPLIVAATFLVGAAAAHAQGAGGTPGASAVDAYVEAVPTAKGQTNPATPSGQADPAVADALETVVQSPRYGAPASISPGPDDRPANPALTTSLSESFLSAIGALGTSSDARLVGILLVVLLTTIVAVVLSIRRGPN